MSLFFGAATPKLGRGGEVSTPTPTTALYDSLLLNGTNQYVQLASSPNQTGSFGMVLDVYKTNTTQKVLFNDRFAWPSTIFGIEISWLPDNTIRVIRGFGTTTYIPTISSAISINTWYRIIISYDQGTGDIIFNLNGSEETVANSTSSVAYTGTSTTSRVCASASATQTLQGSVTNFALFNDSLTGAERTELETVRQWEDYSTAVKNKYAVALPLNDGVIDPENDRSANNNDGTLINSPTYTGEQREFTL